MGFLKKNSTDPAVWPAIYSKHVRVYMREDLYYIEYRKVFTTLKIVISVSKL